ncbi:MAG: short-chain dehydrogenase [Lacibacter sp.]
MTNEMIEKFVENKANLNQKVNIHFKSRETVKGIFIHMDDYEELKSKNFWRIVSDSKLNEWEKTKDYNLGRIFNGAEFTRLTETVK